LGDAESSLGDAESSLGDAESSLGDAKSSLGDVTSSLGDAESSLGDVHRPRNTLELALQQEGCAAAANAAASAMDAGGKKGFGGSLKVAVMETDGPQERPLNLSRDAYQHVDIVCRTRPGTKAKRTAAQKKVLPTTRRACFAALGCDGAPHARRLTVAPQPAPLAPSRPVPCHTPPQGSEWPATQHGAHHFQRILNSACMKGEVPHRTYAVCSPEHFH
jgi:hypothetical protein